MITPKDLASFSREDLLALVAEQQRQIAELTATIKALQAEIARLTRNAKGQAAPFSNGTRVVEPKRPGRKPGSGTFRYCEAPRPEETTNPPVDVKVLLEACPVCGGPLEEDRVDLVYTTERPALPRPQITQYRMWVCRCTVCGKRVRGTHPDVVPDQAGATAHRLGPRLMAVAHALPYGVGLPVRKIPGLLQ